VLKKLRAHKDLIFFFDLKHLSAVPLVTKVTSPLSLSSSLFFSSLCLFASLCIFLFRTQHVLCSSLFF
jgi:hypothetical protein